MAKVSISRKRHVGKTITWRVVGSLDTFFLGTFFSGSAEIGGWIAFADDEQITEYEIDLNEVIEKHIIKKMKLIMDGLGLSLDELRVQEKRYVMDDFF